MKMVRFILVGMLLALVGIFVAGTLIDSQWKVSRTVTVNATPDAVFAQLNRPRNWEKWMTWSAETGITSSEYSETEFGVGATAFFGDSNSSMVRKITASEKPRMIAYVLTSPTIGKANGVFDIAQKDGKTVLTWRLEGELRGPIEKFLMATLMKSRLEHIFTESLDNFTTHANTYP